MKHLTIGEQHLEYVRSKVKEQAEKRNWREIPVDFETSAVRWTYNEIKSFFGSKDIRMRIDASKARTFGDLLDALK